ncbi:hypothetical protein EZS27_022227 [termite gut metagenome]|uniref:Uncharacterized protein n=1 Tax=termite gut metagenome TaxID=433724 RepID=A0A5J4R759_9ZZZZ
MMIKFDTYSLKARIYPCIVVLLPCFLLAILYVTNVEVYYHYFTSFAALGVSSFLLAQIGRDRGKKKEKVLFEYWGGKPTSMILRHSDEHLDVHTKKRYHTKLEQIIPEIKIPTHDEEQENLQAADTIYESCTKYLISKTRDVNKYPLLFKENINYGFRRNLWGMKIWALSIVIICLFIHSLIATEKYTTIETVNVKDWGILIVLTLFILFWLITVNREWIKIAAYAYAERLHETLNEQI